MTTGYNNGMKSGFERLKTEKRILVKAVVYAMGFWGFTHLAIAIVKAIYRHDLHLVNAIRLTNLDFIFGRHIDSAAVFVFGWLVYVVSIYLAYALLRRSR